MNREKPKMWSEEQWNSDNDMLWSEYCEKFNKHHKPHTLDQCIDIFPLNLSDRRMEYQYYKVWYSKCFTKLGKALT